MTIAARRLLLEEYQEIDRELESARQSMKDRDLELAKVFDSIEIDMTLLGATGVEDQLQEGVQETLEALKAAGIKVIIFEKNSNCQVF